MAKKSGSKRKADAQVDEVVERLRKDAAPALARALNLDSAESVEAALNAAVELLLAARATVRALPLPAEAREHLERAEAEGLRAARMAAKGMTRPGGKSKSGAAKRVNVDFAAPAKPRGPKVKR